MDKTSVQILKEILEEQQVMLEKAKTADDWKTILTVSADIVRTVQAIDRARINELMEGNIRAAAAFGVTNDAEDEETERLH